MVEAGGYRFVMLDSLVDAVEGERVDEGRLGDDQLAWLDAELAASPAPDVRRASTIRRPRSAWG